MVGRGDMALQLADMGVRESDTLMAVVQRRGSGPSAQAIIEALLSAVPAGTLLMPAHTGPTVGPGYPSFDVLRTPTIEGEVSETFRKRPDVRRSWHPTHSVCACGRDVAGLLDGHHLCATPCRADSVYGRGLLSRDARILLLGCGLNRMTFLHGVEEWVGVPGRLGPLCDYLLVTPESTRLSVSCQPYTRDVSPNFPRVHNTLAERGALLEGRVGDMSAILLSCRTVYAVTAQLLERNNALFN